jgi:CheY-like chemotaxis protein
MRQLTLLFVDDEPWFTESLRITLEEKGFRCVVRRDASEGWRFISSSEVSALITDIMMPPGEDFSGIDSSEVGYHFVDKVRSKYPRMPIICLSVIGDQTKIQNLKRKHVQYLRKGETPLNTAVRLVESKATGLRRAL